MPPSPVLSPCLATLRREIDLRWPRRDRSFDGWVGDSEHARRESDHNPDRYGVVHALDVTRKGIRAWPLVVAATHHPNVHYVIFRGLIFSRTHTFRPSHYTGPDPHESHIHISVFGTQGSRMAQRNWLSGH